MSTEDVWVVMLIGAGATAVTDVWASLRQRLLGTAPPNYALLGRWIAYLGRGKLRHDSIAGASPLPAEGAIGWSAHYAIGIAFAFLLPAFFGVQWVRQPTFIPALSVGVGTVLAPFLVMQPAMGAGFAASRTPRPTAARIQSLVNHAVFGIGLFATATVIRVFSQT